MKGLILSGGKGSRLRPLTYTRAKQLIPIANKPILFYALESVRDAGIRDIGIIVGDTKNEIMEALGDGSRFGVKLTYIQQEAPLGLAHAVLTAESFIQDEPFVMFLGDNFIQDKLETFVRKYEETKSNALLLLNPVSHPQDFGVVELKDNKIVRLVEKPKNPPSNLALVGVYLFDKHIFQAARKIKPSFRNELEITDAISVLLQENYTIHCHIITGWWKDTGTLEDILEANRIALEHIDAENHGVLQGDSILHGRVYIGKGTKIVDSMIRGPAVIGENCIIRKSYVGPFTSIGDEACIEESEVEHSILLKGASIQGIGSRIQDSLLGVDAKIIKNHTRPHALKFMVGDHSQVHVL